MNNNEGTGVVGDGPAIQKNWVSLSSSLAATFAAKKTTMDTMFKQASDQGLTVVGHHGEDPVVPLYEALLRIHELEEEVRNLSDLATSLAETQVHPQVSETKEPELTWTGNLLKVTAI